MTERDRPLDESLDLHRDRPPTEAEIALEPEAKLPLTGWQQKVSKGLEFGLETAESIGAQMTTFSSGKLPHYAGISTFLKAPYVENVRQVLP